MSAPPKIRIAFIHIAGLSAGGTEKFLQNIAANLPRDEFDVHFYYASGVPLVDKSGMKVDGGVGYTDPDRMRYMKVHGVRLIEFHAHGRDISTPHIDWVGTDFWEKFDEKNYDIIQIGSPGDALYPVHLIKKTPVVDSVHYNSGVNNQFNVSRVLHVSRSNAQRWVESGGDPQRVVIVSHPIEIPEKTFINLRHSLGLGGKFVFGSHQRVDDGIFSEVPLLSYKNIENDNTFFLMLGGSPLYQKQAQSLGLRNVKFLAHSGDPEFIFSYLSTLDVYAHGRKDGEINSMAMAEAMAFGLPVVSHKSSSFNGHIEAIGEAGTVVDTVDEYTAEMARLLQDRAYYALRSSAAKNRFKEKYELKEQVKNIAQIYRDVVEDPFPHMMRRLYIDKTGSYWGKVKSKLSKVPVVHQFVKICCQK